MASNGAGCVSRAKAGPPGRATGCFAGWAWDKRKVMSLVSELLGNLAPHGVDNVTLTCSLLPCLLDYRVNDLPKIRYPGKVEQNVLDCAKVFCSERTLSVKVLSQIGMACLAQWHFGISCSSCNFSTFDWYDGDRYDRRCGTLISLVFLVCITIQTSLFENFNWRVQNSAAKIFWISILFPDTQDFT